MKNMQWDSNLRSSDSYQVTNTLYQGGTYQDHIKQSQALSEHMDKRRPSTAQVAFQSNRLARLYEKYEAKIRMQHEDGDSETGKSGSVIARDFFLKNVDHTKAADQKVLELTYQTRLRNPALNPRKYIGSRPLTSVGYKHYFNWSRRSIELEQKIREYYDIRNLSVVTDHVSLLQSLPSGVYLPSIDTFWAVEQGSTSDEFAENLLHRTQTADHFDWGRNRVIETLHIAGEIDSIALSAINDFLHYQKLARAHFSGNVASNAKNSQGSAEKEGDCKVEAVLIAVACDGFQHIRPLCTTADVTLAMHELLDGDIFEQGYIQLPHTLNMHYQRWTEGYYRYLYRAKEECHLEYVRTRIPSEHLDVAHYFTPAVLCEHKNLQVVRVPLEQAPAKLRDFCDSVVAAMYSAFHTVGKAVLSMDFDFEAIVTGFAPFGKDLPKVPHRIKPGSGWDFNYRAACFRNIVSKTSYAGKRRNAVAGVEGMKRNFLKRFHGHFMDAAVMLSLNQHPYVADEDHNLAKLMAYETARKWYVLDEGDDDSDEEILEENKVNAATEDETSSVSSDEQLSSSIDESAIELEQARQKESDHTQFLLKKYHYDKRKDERRESNARLLSAAREDRRQSVRGHQEKHEERRTIPDKEITSLGIIREEEESESSPKITEPVKEPNLHLSLSEIVSAKAAVKKMTHTLNRSKAGKRIKEENAQLQLEKDVAASLYLDTWLQSRAEQASQGSPGRYAQVVEHTSIALANFDARVQLQLLQSPHAVQSKQPIPRVLVQNPTASPMHSTQDLHAFLSSKRNPLKYAREVHLQEEMETSVREFCEETDVLDMLRDEDITQGLKAQQLRMKLYLKEREEEARIKAAAEAEEEENRLRALVEQVKDKSLRVAEQKRKRDAEKKAASAADAPISTAAELAQRKQEREDDLERTLLRILDLLDPSLAERIRRGLSNYLERLRKSKLQRFIMRRREQEIVDADQITQLKRFFYSLPILSDTSDTSSSDSDDESEIPAGKGLGQEDDDFNLSDLIGDLANDKYRQNAMEERAKQISREAEAEAKRSRVQTPIASAPGSAGRPGIGDDLLRRLSSRTSTPKATPVEPPAKVNVRSRTMTVAKVMLKATEMIPFDESKRRRESNSSYYYHYYNSQHKAWEAMNDSSMLSALEEKSVGSQESVSEASIAVKETPVVAPVAAVPKPRLSLLPEASKLWTSTGSDMMARLTREIQVEEEMRRRRQAMLVGNSNQQAERLNDLRESHKQKQSLLPQHEDDDSDSDEEDSDAGDRSVSKAIDVQHVAGQGTDPHPELLSSANTKLFDISSTDSDPSYLPADQKSTCNKPKNNEKEIEERSPIDEEARNRAALLRSSSSATAAITTSAVLAMAIATVASATLKTDRHDMHSSTEQALLHVDDTHTDNHQLQEQPEETNISTVPVTESRSHSVPLTTSNSEDAINISSSNSSRPTSSHSPKARLRKILPPQVNISRKNSERTDVPSSGSTSTENATVSSLALLSALEFVSAELSQKPGELNEVHGVLSVTNEEDVLSVPEVKIFSVSDNQHEKDSSVVLDGVGNDSVALPIAESAKYSTDAEESERMQLLHRYAGSNSASSVLSNSVEMKYYHQYLLEEKSSLDSNKVGTRQPTHLLTEMDAESQGKTEEDGDNDDVAALDKDSLLEDMNHFSLLQKITVPTPRRPPTMDFRQQDPLITSFFAGNCFKDSQSHGDTLHQSMLGTNTTTTTNPVQHKQNPHHLMSHSRHVAVPLQPETADAIFSNGRIYPKSKYGRRVVVAAAPTDSSAAPFEQPRIPSKPKPSAAIAASSNNAAFSQPVPKVGPKQALVSKQRVHKGTIPDTPVAHPKLGLMGQTIVAPSTSSNVAPKTSIEGMTALFAPSSEVSGEAVGVGSTNHHHDELLMTSTSTQYSQTPHPPYSLMPAPVVTVSPAPLSYTITVVGPQKQTLPGLMTVAPVPNIPSLSPPCVPPAPAMLEAMAFAPIVSTAAISGAGHHTIPRKRATPSPTYFSSEEKKISSAETVLNRTGVISDKRSPKLNGVDAFPVSNTADHQTSLQAKVPTIVENGEEQQTSRLMTALTDTLSELDMESRKNTARSLSYQATSTPLTEILDNSNFPVRPENNGTEETSVPVSSSSEEVMGSVAFGENDVGKSKSENEKIINPEEESLVEDAMLLEQISQPEVSAGDDVEQSVVLQEISSSSAPEDCQSNEKRGTYALFTNDVSAVLESLSVISAGAFGGDHNLPSEFDIVEPEHLTSPVYIPSGHQHPSDQSALSHTTMKKLAQEAVPSDNEPSSDENEEMEIQLDSKRRRMGNNRKKASLKAKKGSKETKKEATTETLTKLADYAIPIEWDKNGDSLFSPPQQPSTTFRRPSQSFFRPTSATASSRASSAGANAVVAAASASEAAKSAVVVPVPPSSMPTTAVSLLPATKTTATLLNSSGFTSFASPSVTSTLNPGNVSGEFSALSYFLSQQQHQQQQGQQQKQSIFAIKSPQKGSQGGSSKPRPAGTSLAGRK